MTPECPLVLLDADGKMGGAASRDLAKASPDRKAIVRVTGGAEAWKAQGLSWKEPTKLGIDLKGLDMSGITAGATRLRYQCGMPWAAAHGAVAQVRTVASIGRKARLLQLMSHSTGTIHSGTFSKGFRPVSSVFRAGLCAGTQTLLKKYNENSTIVTGTAAALAVAGASVFLFTELETVLQLVGVAFALQFLARKLVLAEEREKTFKEVKYLIQDKIAAGVCFHCLSSAYNAGGQRCR